MVSGGIFGNLYAEFICVKIATLFVPLSLSVNGVRPP